MTDDEHAIRTPAALREVAGQGLPGLELKNQAQLDEFAVDFTARSPFPVLSTSGADERAVEAVDRAVAADYRDNV